MKEKRPSKTKKGRNKESMNHKEETAIYKLIRRGGGK
jgi:hypothetical protein